MGGGDEAGDATGTRPTSTQSHAPAAPSVQASPPAGCAPRGEHHGDDDGRDGDDASKRSAEEPLVTGPSSPARHRRSTMLPMRRDGGFPPSRPRKVGWEGEHVLLVKRVDSRRVFVLGVAGLVPAALVTLLLVHQPSIGDRRLYPMLRGPLTLVGLGLALATLIAWATASNRLSRPSLSGLAWAGVTVLLCIGPFLESAPAPACSP